MDIYISSPKLAVIERYKAAQPNSEVNILLPYGFNSVATDKFLTSHRHLVNKICRDAGTYTLNFAKYKTNITFPGYIQDLFKYNHCQVEIIFNFDDNFTENGFTLNLQKQKILEGCGFRITPVAHDYPGSEIDHYIKERYPVIALGFTEYKILLEEYIDIINKVHSYGGKVHKLGIGDFSILRQILFDSCDTSNWARSAGNGYCYFLNSNNETIIIYFKDSSKKKKQRKTSFEETEYCHEFLSYIQDNLGLNYKDLYRKPRKYRNNPSKYQRKPSKYLVRQMINLHYYVQIQSLLRKEHASLKLYMKIIDEVANEILGQLFGQSMN